MQGNPYFKELNDGIFMVIIRGMRLYRFENGETIFWEGDECAGLNVIYLGTVGEGVARSLKAIERIGAIEMNRRHI